MSGTSSLPRAIGDAVFEKRYMLFLLGVVICGFLLRLYSAASTAIINNDGVVYISQAMALYAGNWGLAKSCGTEYISLYHLLIPPAYAVIGHWEWAARSVSILFGTLALIPFFFLARSFCTPPWALLATAAYALNPFFVEKSGDAIKDPLGWFFSTLGFLLFINALKSERRLYLFSLSCLSFCIGIFARIEILAYLAGTLVFVMFTGERRAKRTTFFVAPLLIIVVGLIVSAVFFGVSEGLWSDYLLPRLRGFFSDFGNDLGRASLWKQTIEFLTLSAKFLTQVAFPPFLALILWGVLVVKRAGYGVKPFRYLLLLFFVSFIALYGYSFEFITVYRARFAVLMVLPLLPFIGPGLERCSALLQRKGFSSAKGYLVLGLIIVACSLPFSIDSRREDKRLYREIGEFVASIDSSHGAVIAGPDARIAFYAAIRNNAMLCGAQRVTYERFFMTDYAQLNDHLRQKGVTYFVWDEKYWKNGGYDFPDASAADFEMVKTWKRGAARLVLYKIRSGNYPRQRQ